MGYVCVFVFGMVVTVVLQLVFHKPISSAEERVTKDVSELKKF